MAETKRCPHCGGSNPVDAEWCGQCLERFTPKPAPEPEPAAASAPAQVAPAAPDVTAERFVVDGAGRRWLELP